MADDMTSLADLVLINDKNLADLNISDLFDDAPLLRVLFAEKSSNGTDHKYLKETQAPVVGFRAANDGRDADSSVDGLVTINLKILDATFKFDKAVADAYHKGPEALIAREGMRHLKAAFFAAEQQVINGAGADSAGFVGLHDAATLDALADPMVINAGGTTASTASSVYLIRTGIDDLTVVSTGEIVIDETTVQEIAGSSSGFLPGYYTPIVTYLGLAIGSAVSVARIANCTEDSGKGLTDDLIYEALEAFPAGRQPNLIAMGRRSLKQLRDSRTATNATGAPAPRPTEVDGIRIVTTDGITKVEAIET